MSRKFYLVAILIIITILGLIMCNNVGKVLAADAVDDKATFVVIGTEQNKVTLKIRNYTSEQTILYWGNNDELTLEQGEGIVIYSYPDTGLYNIVLKSGNYKMSQGVKINNVEGNINFGNKIKLVSLNFNKVKITVDCQIETFLDWKDGSSCYVPAGVTTVTHDYAYKLGTATEYNITLGSGTQLRSAKIIINDENHSSSFVLNPKHGLCTIEKWIYPTTPEVETIIVLDVKWLPDQLVLLNIDTDIKYNPSNSSSTRISVQSTFWVAYTIKSEIVNNQVWWQIQLMDKTTGWVRQDLANPPSLIVITS